MLITAAILIIAMPIIAISIIAILILMPIPILILIAAIVAAIVRKPLSYTHLIIISSSLGVLVKE
jgi:hypothetical protein